MRQMGFMFLSLAFLAGVTVGTVEIALVNVVVFLGLALLAEHLLAPRFGRIGVVFGMAGAFFVSILWPVVAYAWRGEAYCAGENCAAEESEMTVTLSPA